MSITKLGLIGLSVALTTSTVRADDPDYDGVLGTRPVIDVDSGDDDDVGTATGDILEGRGELLKDSGKAQYFRSLSAVELQKAIDHLLDNRRERIESYYESRDYRDAEVYGEKEVVGGPDVVRSASEESAGEKPKVDNTKPPQRLNKTEINPETGEIYWPKPLDADALKPYRKPIEETLAKRMSPGETYREFDYQKVHRMIELIREGVESIEDRMDAGEVVALMKYMDRIDYEARFNADNERIDY